MQRHHESVDMVNTSMRQLRVLEWQVDMISRHQRERLALANTPTPRPSRPPSPSQGRPQLPAFTQDESAQQRPEQTIPYSLQLPPLSQYRSQPRFPMLPLPDAVKREPSTPEGRRQPGEQHQSRSLLPMPPNEPADLPMTLDAPASPSQPTAMQWPV